MPPTGQIGVLHHGGRAHALALVALAAVALGVTAHRSHWIAGYLERLGTDRIASGVNGLGRDYAFNVWIPTHALWHGLDPYDPAKTTVRERWHANLPAGLYTPSILLLLSPLALLPLPDAAEVMNALNVLLIWLALLVLIPPRTPRSCALVAVLGVVTVNGYAGESGLLYGQPIGIYLLGIALLARAILEDRWDAAAVVGAVLLMTKAQYAVAGIVLLLALRRLRVVAVAAAATLLLSLPFGALFLDAAGGVSEAAAVVHRSASYAAANYTGAGRSDMLVLLTGGDAGRFGAAGTIVEAVLLCGAAAWLVSRLRMRRGAAAVALVALLVGLELASVYHEWYDLVILMVPAAVLLARPPRLWLQVPLVTAVAFGFVLVDLATRSSFRLRISNLGAVGASLVRGLDLWWPPAISVAMLAAAAATTLLLRRSETA